MTNEEINDLAEQLFGTTTSWRKAGYLTPYGSLLDFSEGSYERTLDHRAIEQVFDEEEPYRFNYVVKFMNAGNIRIMPGCGGIGLTIRPTVTQLKMLKNFVQFMGGDAIVEIFDPVNGDSLSYGEYEDVVSGRVVNDIKRYFDEGINIMGNVQPLCETNAFFPEKLKNIVKRLL